MLAVVTLAVIVLVAIGALSALISNVGRSGGSGSGAGPGSGSDRDQLAETWAVSSYDLSSDYGTFGAVDGTRDGWVVETGTGWVTMSEPSTPSARLVSLDPVDGATQWSRDLPEARCTQLAGDDAELTCLTRPGGGDFELVRIATTDGALVGDPVPVALSHVPYVLTSLGDDGLVVLSADRTISAIGTDGAIGWTQPVAIPSDYELGYLEIDVAHYPEATLLHLGWAIGTVHSTVEGMSLAPCRAIAATPQAWVCEEEDETIARTPGGTELWSGDWADYYMIDGYQRIAPVLLVDNWDGTVTMVDAATGDRGVPLRVAEDSEHLSFVGDAEHPVVTTEDSVVLLDPTGSGVQWETAVSDEYLNIAVGVVVDGVLVMDAANSYGFDLAGGAVLWERGYLASNVYVRGDALVGIDWGGIVRYELP